MLVGGSLPPPIRYLCGLQMSAVEPGSVSFMMPVSDWLLFPQGIVSGSTLGFLVDLPLGCTVQTALPPATPFSTAEISFKFLRTIVPRSGTLTARGRLIHAGKTVAVSLVEVSDDAGRLLAVASTRCTILPRIEAPREVVEQALENPPHLAEPAWPSPHPYQRPVKGEVLPQEIWDQRTGLEIMRALIEGELPAPPLSNLCGIVPFEAEEGQDEVEDADERVALYPGRGQAIRWRHRVPRRDRDRRCGSDDRAGRRCLRFDGPQGLLPAPGVTERPGSSGRGSGHSPRSHRCHRHVRSVRRRRQEGRGGEWVGPGPAWPTRDSDHRVDATAPSRRRSRR